MNSIVFVEQVIGHTPIWVWLILTVVLVLGYLATRPRTILLPRLLILPLIMFALSVYSVFSGPLSAAAAVVWLAALALGAGIGRAIGLSIGAKPGPRAGTVSVPGEWWSLALTFTTFVARYVFAVSAAIAPALLFDQTFLIVKVAMMGVLGGTFLGRTLIIAWVTRRPVSAMQAAN
jgi:hypothetical protein